MMFFSQEFLVFFAIVFALYWAMPWSRARVWLLLAASFYFYARWNRWLALLIAVATVVDYTIARGMELTERRRLRLMLLLLSLGMNLGLLFYFKYANFFLSSLQHGLHLVGSSRTLPVLKVMLPIGISFYIFEAISYTIDVYRKKLQAERSLANFMLFITFFPHLVAGPIVRASHFLPQIQRPKRWDWVRLQVGLMYFLMGLFKKVAIADRMALYADPVFADPGSFATGATWVAVVAYALQIYCDFSGYTDMAIGTAHLLGYKLSLNFNMPYLSANVSEFWHRWHISLSTWLRDYLFIPLGGSRPATACPRSRRWLIARNLMITMMLGGLWHGARWTFVAWGALHGAYLILHRVFRIFCAPREWLRWLLNTPIGILIRVTVTFLAVCTAWVFFRASSFAAAATVVARLVVMSPGSPTPLPAYDFWSLLALVVVCHLVGHFRLWERVWVRLPGPVLGCSYAVLATMVMVLAPDLRQAFIYFQF